MAEFWRTGLSNFWHPHSIQFQVASQEDELTIMETQKEEMSNSLEEVKYELEKSMRRECKLDYRLADVS